VPLRVKRAQAQVETVKMIVQIVRFRSDLSDEEVLQTYEARSPRYRALSGLKQKYYLKFPATGEHGAVYVWDSEEALQAFRESDLARTIPEAYHVQGEPNIVVAEVVMLLRPGE
jgi:heme-degrading monooxygenase HmoA